MHVMQLYIAALQEADYFMFQRTIDSLPHVPIYVIEWTIAANVRPDGTVDWDRADRFFEGKGLSFSLELINTDSIHRTSRNTRGSSTS
jgi:hypothetical protein